MTPAGPPWAFRLDALAHRYPDGTLALDGVTTEIPAGETVAVLGPSGCGKSTLLALLGLLWDGRGPEGGLRYRDRNREYDLRDLRPGERAELRATRFGFVLQSSYLLPHFTCLQNVGMPLALHGWPAPARERWADGLVAGDLRGRMGECPRAASAGQRQRFAALRAVIADPAVVFADEPSSNLDPGNTRAMFDLLAAWKAGTLFEANRKAFAADPGVSAAVREWLAEKAAEDHPRTLILVCHDIHTARARADRFLLVNGEHRLEISFRRAEWDRSAATVERVLGLQPGAAGRDEG